MHCAGKQPTGRPVFSGSIQTTKNQPEIRLVWRIYYRFIGVAGFLGKQAFRTGGTN